MACGRLAYRVALSNTIYPYSEAVKGAWLCTTLDKVSFRRRVDKGTVVLCFFYNLHHTKHHGAVWIKEPWYFACFTTFTTLNATVLGG